MDPLKSNLDISKKTHTKREIAFFSTVALLATVCGPVLSAQASDTPPIQTRHPFIETLAVPATRIAAENDLYPSVMLAQAALESGWGQSQLAAPPTHNLFGIKGNYQGQTTAMETFEDRGNQQYYTVDAGFRKYPSYWESLEDYAVVLKNGPSWDPTFYEGAWRSEAPTYQDATAHLTGRYATDSVYNQKLDTLITSHDLDWYDTAALEDVEEATPPSSPSLSTPLESETYLVKTGDTLWQIAQEYGLTVAEIQAQNAVTGSLIHPAQVLQLGVAGADTPVSIENEETQTTVIQDQQPTARYTVASGDTLYRIASHVGLTVSELKKANGLTSDVIHPGQALVTGSYAVKHVEIDESSVTPQSSGSYEVQRGDTLYRIASNFGMSVSELKAMNKLTSDVIHPGQRLWGSMRETLSTISSPVESSGAYTVQNGDTLYRITSDVGLSVSELQEANGLTSDVIHPGQVLVTGNHVLSLETDESSVTPQQDGSYTVQGGDTLYRIASDSGMSVSELQAINYLSSDMIQPGDVLLTSFEQMGGHNVISQSVFEEGIPPSPPSSEIHIVQSGETLYRIALEAGISIEELKGRNQLESDRISIGQALEIEQLNNETSHSSGTHTVKPGDTLYTLARANDVSVVQLMTWNSLTSSLIQLGQTLVIK